jgi:TRAP-type C4-dicarboxylate transport system permease small subunit
MSRPPRIPEDAIGALLLAALLVITLANVFVRYFTDQSFAWTEEVSSVLMLVLAMVGSSAAIFRDSHIRIEYFFKSRSPSRERGFARLSALANGLFFFLLGLLSAQMCWDEFRFGDISPAIGLPKWWYSIWLPILCGVLSARSLGRTRNAGQSAEKYSAANHQ